MIINVGGRTDIVNYFTPWLINRLEEGFVYTRNPYNPNQVTHYDLSPDIVDAIIFCSKNYSPILEHLPKIIKKYNIFCYYTITSYGNDVEANVPCIDKSIDTLKKLSEIVGKDRVSWRFDPILLTEKYTTDYHIKEFEYITSRLHDNVSFCVFSFVDMYRKVYKNMPEIIQLTKGDKRLLIENMGKISKKYSMKIQSCAYDENLEKYGINNSGCVTTDILEKANNIKFKENIKHRGSRKYCKCLPWNDIGAYDTCSNLCKYCYANNSAKRVERNIGLHDDSSPLLIGKLGKKDVIHKAKQKSMLLRSNKQTTLL